MFYATSTERVVVIVEIDGNMRQKRGRADDRRTDEYLTQASQPKDEGEVEPKHEMKDL
jgi:very-short-patch-repair endonuclease